jgi:transcriptional regulator with AAA-type ATPase domain
LQATSPWLLADGALRVDDRAVVEHTRTQPVDEILRTGSGEPRPQLFLVMNASAPMESSVRVLLDDFQEVVMGRGTPRAFETQAHRGRDRLFVRLADDFVSTRHTRFFRANGGWWFEDLGSKNGTLLDGKRVDKSHLHDGAVIEIGRNLFLYRLEETGDRTPIVSDADLVAPLASLRTFNGPLAAQFAKLAAVASSPTVSILVLGETGTGKGVVAKAAHELSQRDPFVVVNLATIPENLLSTELFGHRKGSFSGAASDQKGLVRAADGGTLFLDELGDLPPAAQAALLLVLQNREVLPLGFTAPIPVDLRVVAATNQDVAALVNRGQFRHDLLTRLEGLTLRLPTLANRREDIGLLLRDIIGRTSPAPQGVAFGNLAARALLLHDWPGNVRELEKVVGATLALARGKQVEAAHLPEPVRRVLRDDSSPELASRRQPAASGESPLFDPKNRDHVVALLLKHGGNVSAAARAIGRGHQQLFKWIKAHGIDVAALRP